MNLFDFPARLTVCALLLPLGACADDYYNRIDTVSLAAGDAKEVNRVAHTIDPWPRVASNPDLTFNGVRMAGAQQRYESGQTTETKATATSEVTDKQQ